MPPQTLRALFALANSKASLPGTPYTVSFLNGAEETNRGGYSATTTYNQWDVVSYGGYNWVSETTQTGNAPLAADGKTPNAGWEQHLLTAYNRLRSNLMTACNVGGGRWPPTPAGLMPAPAWAQSISGPWPCTPNVYYNDLEFIFPSTTGVVTVTLGETISILAGQCTSWVLSDLQLYETFSSGADGLSPYQNAAGLFEYAMATQATFNLMVGGNRPAQLSGTFYVQGFMEQGMMLSGTSIVSDGTDPSALASVNATNWIPGAPGWVKSTYYGYVRFTCTITTPITVNPGIYTVTLTGAAGGDDVNAGYGITHPSRVLLLIDSQTNTLQGNATIARTETVSTLTNGIHNTENVYECACPVFDHVTGLQLPFGLYSANYQPNPPWPPAGWDTIGGSLDAPFKNYPPGWPGVFQQPTGFYLLNIMSQGSVTISANVAGVWTALIPPTGGLAMNNQGQMPWNLFTLSAPYNANVISPPWPPKPYYYGYTITKEGAVAAVFDAQGHLNDEQMVVPSPWAEGSSFPNLGFIYFPAGFIVEDSNGNWQQCVSAGRSYGIEPYSQAQIAPPNIPVPGFPVWATTVGGITHELPYTWPATGEADPPVAWQMVQKPSGGQSFQPAQALSYSSPAYPVMKSTDVWAAHMVVKVGQMILDSKGDIRICTASNSLIGQYGGTTGATQPAWVLGSQTAVTDGSVTWNFYMQGIGPTGGGFVGSWIYRVNINPLGTVINGIQQLPQTGVAPTADSTFVTADNTSNTSDETGSETGSGLTCQLGCIRNGTFVSFGTFPVGPSCAALWPIFTNTPLVYVCSQRLDVQASFFTSNPAPWGGIGWPILASFYNDMVGILNLIT